MPWVGRLLLPEISAYLDEPKTLEELKAGAGTRKAGYHTHHIVEQKAARDAGFPAALINGPDNLVRIPALKHCQITAWYMTRSKDYSGLSPRDYLRDKNWEERVQIGHDALILHGVLKP